jgi:hypothetical protein
MLALALGRQVADSEAGVKLQVLDVQGVALHLKLNKIS